MGVIVKKEIETTDSGITKRYDIFEKTRYNITYPKMHTHSYYEIIMLNEGELTCKIDLDRFVRLSVGDIIFIPSFIPHATFREHEGIMRCTVVKFSPSFLMPSELTRSDVVCLLNTPHYLEDHYIFKNGEKENTALEPMLSRTLSLMTDKPLGYETALRGELSSVYVMLLNTCKNELITDGEQNFDTAHSEALRYALEYVKRNYSYRISMDDLAKKCDMSYYAFSRFFKQMMGKSFSEYLIDTRLCRAQKMLLSDENSVSDIASACGFEYVSYFIRRFKTKYGVTPLEYRKMYNSEK